MKILEERNGICLQSFFFYAIILLLFSMIVDSKDLEFHVKILEERNGICLQSFFLCNYSPPFFHDR